MATIGTNEMKAGNKIMLDGVPYQVVHNEGVKPGKGQAFNRIKLKSIQTGRVLEKTFKSGEQVELADIVEHTVTFLYEDGSHWYFMNDQYETISAPREVVADSAQWLKEENSCTLVIWNGAPLSVMAENFVELEVSECEPAVKGDTVNGVLKQAGLETGAQVKVPLFVGQGDLIRVDTRTGEYVARVKS